MKNLQTEDLPRYKKRERNLANVATYENRVNRDFKAVQSNSVWLTDITRHPTERKKSAATKCWISFLQR